MLSYSHDATRMNNPEVGMVHADIDPDGNTTPWQHDPHLNPALNSISSDRVSRYVQNQLAAIIETIPVTISPEITQGEIVSQRLIYSVRVSNKLLF